MVNYTEVLMSTNGYRSQSKGDNVLGSVHLSVHLYVDMSTSLSFQAKSPSVVLRPLLGHLLSTA